MAILRNVKFIILNVTDEDGMLRGSAKLPQKSTFHILN